jgi:hypothetical protein
MVVGVFLPFPFWFWQRRYPKSWVKFVSTPVVLTGVSAMPPATGINYSSWFAIGFIFQYLIRKKNFAWWSKFNYVASAALDSGASRRGFFFCDGWADVSVRRDGDLFDIHLLYSSGLFLLYR